tara:strand:+ start:505 stop:882 length:378 start_codon:yes stop_codon:yes gene_type:complete
MWFGFVKIFGTNNKKSINVISNKFLTDFTLIFRNILDLIDSLFKSFIQIYELLGSSLKNIVIIFKSLTSALIKLLNLFKIIGITFLSFISLIKALYQATKAINILNKIESAKNNLIKLFKEKTDE